jgi:hypothetical protein
MKIRPLGVELFHADGPTDRHNEANSRSSQFCESALNLHLQRQTLYFDTQNLSYFYQ